MREIVDISIGGIHYAQLPWRISRISQLLFATILIAQFSRQAGAKQNGTVSRDVHADTTQSLDNLPDGATYQPRNHY